MYVSYHQDDWNTWLPLAIFAYNNSDHSSKKQSPFSTVYGRDPHFDSIHITQDTPAGRLSTKIQSVQKDVKRELEAATNRFKRYADKSRASPTIFNPGDMKVRTHAYHLKLPSQWKSIHPVFHISLFEPVKTSKMLNRHQEPPPPIIIEEEEEWEVSQILDSSLKRGKLWSLVEWKGFSQDPERATWESTENLKNCPELLPQQASPCVGAEELTIPRWGVLSQPWKLPSCTPYGISVPYQSYGNLAISIITGPTSPLIFFWPSMVSSLLGPTWPLHHPQALPGFSLLLGTL
ncbi:hypothetical protein O181_090266 [Austropuccinia psidii MF-1]|uniref:Chromo domain-containing protein n=1 Tax=Austropuccinia psidii MF-1 TaxID=1389203 RepID=A0A9Q3P8K0_9BASI|nr:hypothetical protein [Austropuccinia psidii MF-1]